MTFAVGNYLMNASLYIGLAFQSSLGLELPKQGRVVQSPIKLTQG